MARGAPRQRVLLVVDALSGGGAEQHVTDLAAALLERDWAVDVACSALSGATATAAAGSAVAARLAHRGARVQVVGPRLVKRRVSPRYVAGLRRLLADGRAEGCGYDLVHAHIHASEVAAALALPARLETGSSAATRLVLTEHTEAPWRGMADRLAARWACTRADAVIAVSRAVATSLVADLGLAPERVHLQVPVGKPVAPLCSPAGPVDEVGAVGFIGRLAPEKGVDVLLVALARLAASGRPVRALVAGEGPERPHLEALSRRLGLAPHVQFLGHVDNVAPVLARLAVLAVPSRSDGAPLVAHEALSAGVPVVGSAVGGIPDRLADGRAGVLVPPEDPAALADALAALVADPARRARLAAAGRVVASRTSYTAAVDAVEGLYRALLAPGPRTRLDLTPWSRRVDAAAASRV